MSEETAGANAAQETAGEQEQQTTFTQADVDRIVGERVQRERAKYADYDAIKSAAGEKATLEERLASVEKRAAEAETRALRANVANEYGISKEDRDLFLTAGDEETLKAQAKRLADRDADQKRKAPVVSRQGTDNTSPKDDEMREFTRSLFVKRD